MKILFTVLSIILLSGCSMSNKDWSALSSSMDSSGEYGTCNYYDESENLGRDGDISGYYEMLCDTAYITVYNSSSYIEYECDALFNGSTSTVYLGPGESRDVAFSYYGGSREFGYSCGKYNMPAQITDNPVFKEKISNGYYYISYKNTNSVPITCTMSDSDDYLIEDDVYIKAGAWSKWLDFENGIKTDCVKMY